MWAIHSSHVPAKNPHGRPYDAWVIFVPSGGGSSQDQMIHERHDRVDFRLGEANVSFSQITSARGRQEIEGAFDCAESRHPLFLVLGKHPHEYREGDSYLIVKWEGQRAATLAEGLEALVELLSLAEARRLLAGGAEEWSRFEALLGERDSLTRGAGVNAVVLRYGHWAPWKSEDGSPYNGWLVFLSKRTNAKDKVIRERECDIENQLASQAIGYVKPREKRLKEEIYDLFGCKNKRHPLFLALGKHITAHESGDSFLVIQWGKFPNADSVADDLQTLLDTLSTEQLEKLMTDNPSAWPQLIQYITENDFRTLTAGVNASFLRVN